MERQLANTGGCSADIRSAWRCAGSGMPMCTKIAGCVLLVAMACSMSVLW